MSEPDVPPSLRATTAASAALEELGDALVGDEAEERSTRGSRRRVAAHCVALRVGADRAGDHERGVGELRGRERAEQAIDVLVVAQVAEAEEQRRRPSRRRARRARRPAAGRLG